MTPKISVVIPIYNMERYLPAALTSVTEQTLSEIEVVCVNDGSTDNSLAILKEWQARDNRIKIIDKQNEGVGKARNDAIACATGAFISFVDPDDTYPSTDTLETLYQCAITHNIKVAGGQIQKIDAKGLPILDEVDREFLGLTFCETGLLRYVDWQYDYGYQAFLFERKLLVENDITFPLLTRFQDPPFFVRALATADNFYRLDVPTYSYRIWGQSQGMKLSKIQDLLSGVFLNLEFARKNELAKLYYLNALRLQKEVSYTLTNGLEQEGIGKILLRYFHIYDELDCAWLASEGYDTASLATPDCLLHLLTVHRKYTHLRRNPILRTLSKLIKLGD